METLIHTDLDATLLDHWDYSWQAAQEALTKIRQMEVPLVLNSSKTAAEMQEFWQKMELSSPYCCENGAVVIEEDGQAHFIGQPISEWGAEVRKAASAYRCELFSSMGTERVIELTGLPLPAARLAKQRLASEPFVWHDSQEKLSEFCRAVEALGLQTTQGGRFFHIGSGTDKGQALLHVQNQFQEKSATPLQSIALGDSRNDIPMLSAADIAVVMERPDGTHMQLQHPRKILAAAGPGGWNKAVLELLTEQEKDQ